LIKASQLIKLTAVNLIIFLIYLFLILSVISEFLSENKSVVIWLKTCQLYLGSCWTFCRPL